MLIRMSMILLSSLAILSCNDGDGGTPPDEGSTPGVTPILSPDSSDSTREAKVLQDATALEPLLDGFWTEELQSVYGYQFDPPDRFEYYSRDGNKPCGNSTFAGKENAYYCSADADEYVAFDLEWFKGYLVDFPQGATTFLILAHEWGHAVQDTWLENGGPDTWEPASRQELNADCLAGVFLSWGISSGNIIEDAGDADAIWSWLYSGGYNGPWLDPPSHGTGEERRTAFSDGYLRGTDHCRVNY